LSEAVRDCDVLQVVCGSPAWANSVIGLGKPVSVQCATRAKIERRRRNAKTGALAWWRRSMTQVTDQFEKTALRAVDAIQVENPWMLDYARSINAGRDVDLRYAPPGVDAVRFCPLAERDLRRDPYILCVGRLDDPRKNIELLLEAFALIPASMRNSLRLTVAGQAGPPQSFWGMAESLGVRRSIEFIHRPSREELVRLYQAATLFALPSDEEGLGVALLEAMACGVPAVSTRSGGPDGVITDGEDGFLVPLDNAAAMASAIGRLVGDQGLNHAMGRRARSAIEARYAEKVAGSAFIDVWNTLLEKTSKR
jgi:D-inositol-3-phosphate glycosyltransferase